MKFKKITLLSTIGFLLTTAVALAAVAPPGHSTWVTNGGDSADVHNLGGGHIHVVINNDYDHAMDCYWNGVNYDCGNGEDFFFSDVNPNIMVYENFSTPSWIFYRD